MVEPYEPGIPLPEAAELLGIKPDTLRKQCERGKLHGRNAYKEGDEWRIVLSKPDNGTELVPTDDGPLADISVGLDKLLLRLDQQAETIRQQAETIGDLRRQVKHLKARVEGLLTIVEARRDE